LNTINTEFLSRKVSENELIQSFKELDAYGYSKIENFLTATALKKLLTITQD